MNFICSNGTSSQSTSKGKENILKVGRKSTPLGVLGSIWPANREFDSSHTLAVFLAARIGSTRSRLPDLGTRKPAFMSRVLRSALLKPGASSQALTFSGRARFIAWCQRHTFLREYQQGLRHFWSCRACLRYGHALGPTLKRPCDTPIRLVEHTTNI